MKTKPSIDVTITPPGKWNNYFTIETVGQKEYEIWTDYLTCQKLAAKMLDIGYEIHENTIIMYGWIPGPEKR